MSHYRHCAYIPYDAQRPSVRRCETAPDVALYMRSSCPAGVVSQYATPIQPPHKCLSNLSCHLARWGGSLSSCYRRHCSCVDHLVKRSVRTDCSTITSKNDIFTNTAWQEKVETMLVDAFIVVATILSAQPAAAG